ncbi:MAG TPA: uracil-DNA glycosylase [Candidatus Saccharimonadales bacterium]|nr:uracil-DNA glycosylase [Candidatus Saccharimonadales bacterium]
MADKTNKTDDILQAKQRKLDQIKAEIIKKHVCPDLAKTAKNMVFGDGSPSAEIVFVGEAPGKNEDLTGLPFVGAAGKFLDEMLAMIGLDRKDVYITSILKYRPPNNRDPLPEEKAAFLPYLQQQIEVIRPKLLVPLGRHGMGCFLPNLQISKVHGQPKRIRLNFKGDGGKSAGIPVVILPLFHPAAALYNGSLRQTLIDDFAQIPEIMKLINN